MSVMYSLVVRTLGNPLANKAKFRALNAPLGVALKFGTCGGDPANWTAPDWQRAELLDAAFTQVASHPTEQHAGSLTQTNTQHGVL